MEDSAWSIVGTAPTSSWDASSRRPHLSLRMPIWAMKWLSFVCFYIFSEWVWLDSRAAFLHSRQKRLNSIGSELERRIKFCRFVCCFATLWMNWAFFKRMHKLAEAPATCPYQYRAQSLLIRSQSGSLSYIINEQAFSFSCFYTSKALCFHHYKLLLQFTD